jgi:hypothetical protein
MSTITTDSHDTLDYHDPGTIKIDRSLDFQLMSYIDPFFLTDVHRAPLSAEQESWGTWGLYIIRICIRPCYVCLFLSISVAN